MRLRQLLPLTLLLTAAVAFAQTAGDPSTTGSAYQVPTDDPALLLISSLFTGTGRYSAMMSGAMGAFNKGVLLFATLLFTWVVIVGTINTAKDGVVLGKKWSSTWLPVRFGLAAALIVPAPATGLSVGQGFILYAATQGIGIANDVWSSALDAGQSASQNSALQSASAQQNALALMNDPVFATDLDTMARQVLGAEVCSELLRFQTGTTPQQVGIQPAILVSAVLPEDPTSASFLSTVGGYTQGAISATGNAIQGLAVSASIVPPAPVNNAKTVRWGWSPGATAQGPAAACGHIETMEWSPSSSANAFSLSTGDGNTATIGGLDTLTAQQQTTAMNGLIDAQAKAIADMAARAAPLAMMLADPCGGSSLSSDGATSTPQPACATDVQKDQQIAAYLQGAKALYAQEISQAVAGATKITAASNQSRKSWIYAAASYYGLASNSNQAMKAATYVPAFVRPDPENFLVPGQEDTPIRAFENASITDLMAVRTFARTAGLRMAQWAAYKVAGDPNNPEHMLVQMHNAGEWMKGSAASLALAKEALSASPVGAAGSMAAGAAGKLGGIPILGSALGAITGTIGLISTAVTWGIGALAIFGVIMSLLPFLPVLYWIGGVVGWVIAVIEGVIAAPLWIASHMSPEGEGFASARSIAGYQILLEIVLRPAIMVLGLLSSLWLMDTSMRYASVLYWASASAISANDTVGIPTILCFICLYIFLCTAIVRTTAKLSMDFPNTIARWFGGQQAAHDRGESFAGEMDRAKSAVAEVSKAGINAGTHLISAAGRAGSSPSKASADKSESQAANDKKSANAPEIGGM